MTALPDSIQGNYKKKHYEGTNVYYKKKKPNLTKRIWSMFFHEDFHFLRYWNLIEQIFTIKYDITREDLFFLFYLSSKELFSIIHVEHYPLYNRPYHKTRIKRYVDRGFVELVKHGGRDSKNVYRPTLKLKLLERDLYSKTMLRQKFKIWTVPDEVKKENCGYNTGSYRALLEEFNKAVDLFNNVIKDREDAF